MQIISNPREMQRLGQSFGCARQTSGFVPTMGALHAGHLELCRRARAENERFVASIFVNPAQFNPHEDLDRYPRPLERDLELLEGAGCNAVFTPDARAMYGDGDALHGTWIDVAPLGEMWEGVTRPGHLRGVATVVAKLFNIVLPTRAYFGEKDFQQLRVVEQLVRELNFATEIVPVATLREPDGLALSSRNHFLSAADKVAAATIYRALQAGTQAARNGETDVAALGRAINAVLEAEPQLTTQYVAIVDAQTLQPLHHLEGKAARVLIAAHLGEVRLIDNMAI